MAALRDQIDRALCGREGEPARAMVEEAIAKTCYRLGCRGIHPLEWQPMHLIDELRDDLTIEAYLKHMIQCGWRGKLTKGGRELRGPLGMREAEWEWDEQAAHKHGPMLWESRAKGGWDTTTTSNQYSRSLARRGIVTWATITNAATGSWLSKKEAKYIYHLQDGREIQDYENLVIALNTQTNQEQRERWEQLVIQNKVHAVDIKAEETQEERHRTGTWNFERILAARKTADCLGGFEYAVDWGGGHDIAWTPHVNMHSNANTRDELQQARTNKLRAASLHEWLKPEHQQKETEGAGRHSHHPR